MKLLKLSSTNPGFKTIEFKDGLNIVAGLQLSESEKKTYNGVGKSFSLLLIHLLFGTKLKQKNILTFLKSYGTFILDFEVDNKPHQIKKNFATTFFELDHERVNQTNYPGELKKLLLGANQLEGISFKNIFNAFARRYGENYYSDAAIQQGRPKTDYYQNLVNFYLLGVDLKLIREKHELKDRLNKLKTLKGEIEKLEPHTNTANVKDLRDELKTIRAEKDAFVIAENYDKFEAQADNLTIQINDVRAVKQKLTSKLNNKLKALEQSQTIDVDSDRISRLYEEAQFFFNEKVKVRLLEAQNFHTDLMNNRKRRFESEISALKEEINTLDEQVKPLERSRDLILKDLDSKGALSEYNSIIERIKTIEKQIADLTKYSELLDSLKNDEAELNLQNAQLRAKAARYLHNASAQFDDIEDRFRRLVKKFYENHGGALQVSLADDAKYLFNLDIHVPKDGSQGVNEVKIFCYDFLLYELNPHLLGFIAHDGCIFSEMDPRQKSMIFKVALEYINNTGLQYFVNIGQSSLEEVLDEQNRINILSENEKKQIRQSIRRKLFDKDPTSWLLGQNFA